MEEEAQIYASSRILPNIHEDYQRKFGGDCNERTFKIPFCGGFEICDDVDVVRDYFTDGKEIVIATSKDDWFDKIDYYYEHPMAAKQIAEAGRLRAMGNHTYAHRAQQILACWTVGLCDALGRGLADDRPRRTAVDIKHARARRTSSSVQASAQRWRQESLESRRLDSRCL